MIARVIERLIAGVTLAMRLILAGALAAFACSAGAQGLPATHLKVVGGWDFLVQYKDFEKPFWEKTLPEASAGAVTAEITPFNTLGLKGAEII